MDIIDQILNALKTEPLPESFSLALTVQKIEELIILNALKANNNKITRTADMLKIKRTTLSEKLFRMGMRKSRLDLEDM